MINSVVLVGRLVRDPELRRTNSGTSVASFTVAVDNPGKGVNGEKTSSFIPCTVWNQGADFLTKYAHKGSLVGVTGRINQRSYDKDGRKVQVVEVIAEQVRLLESKGSSNSNAVVADEERSFVASDDNNLSEISLDDDLPF